MLEHNHFGISGNEARTGFYIKRKRGVKDLAWFESTFSLPYGPTEEKQEKVEPKEYQLYDNK